MSKIFKKPGDQIKKLISSMGHCMATDKITVEGFPVGYMYREQPRDTGDSGWCFFSGTESDDYVQIPENIGIYDVNTVANYDKDIIPYLETAAPCAFEKVDGTSNYKRV